ncbi:hypothetical protein VF724_19850, partial [Paenibacillaceae bacterium T2]|nr:hypothetical protein [Paenibacillaceae bacterium T2]
IKVPVYQKNESEHTPVCYCFGWTRSRLKAGQTQDAIERIQMHMKAGRCGCEVNNPQGSCCLANVIEFVKTLKIYRHFYKRKGIRRFLS